MADCLVALGANLGDRSATLNRAITLLGDSPDVQVVARSSFHATKPVGGPADQARFLNAAVRIETSLSPNALLGLLLDIEAQLGRERHERWGPRAMDLDLLMYGDLTCDDEQLAEPHLILPHPRMAFRRFVLAPAAEIAADMVHPTTGWSIGRLLEHLDTAANYIALAGPIGVGKSSLAARLAETESWRLIAESPPSDRLTRYYADPAAEAWETELEFLARRGQLLRDEITRDDQLPQGRAVADRPWAISDFWYDQSLAFARLWLDDVKYAAFQSAWSAAAAAIERPKLIVWLDAPADLLAERVARRGRDYERSLNVAALNRARQTLTNRLSQPGNGPVLRLDAGSANDLVGEVIAAAKAMEPY